MIIYLLFFYIDVYGLFMSVVVILFVVVCLVDVVESLIIGVMIDYIYLCFGKSCLFFLWYVLFYVLFVVLIFVILNFGVIGKFVWVYVIYLGLGFFYIVVNLLIILILLVFF